MNNQPNETNLTAEQQLAIIRAKREAEFALTEAGQQIELLRIQQESQFALTPVGQELRRFEINQRMGAMYAKSTIVPETYRNNVANCAIAVDMAMRMNTNPVMVMQNLYIVHGMPAWSSKFLISTINTCGRFQPLRYECNGLKGDDYGWRCYTYAVTDREKQERLEGSWVTWAMVKAEGWNKKNGSKWLTMAEQMFHYRAAAFWQRMYAPEISCGLSTADEAEDIQDVPFTEITHTGEVKHHPVQATRATAKSTLSNLAAAAAAKTQQSASIGFDNTVPSAGREVQQQPMTGAPATTATPSAEPVGAGHITPQQQVVDLETGEVLTLEQA